jgi:hypothetical protein
MGNPPDSKLAIYLKVSTACPSTSGWVHANSSFFGALKLHTVIFAAKRLKLRVGHRWIKNQYAGQRLGVNPKERRHRSILLLFAFKTCIVSPVSSA